jgi:hypothetical protein
MTISQGVYTQINVSGTGTTLIMNPGVYIIAGGGFSVSNSANVTGTGVMIYNAGSSFPNAGGTFGAISLGSSGNIGLSAPTTGTYAGILIFQSRDNTRAISLNAKSVVGLNGTIYAPAALLSLGGSATWKTPAIVGSLSLSGNGGTALTTAGTDNSTAGTAGQLLGGDLFLYVNDPNGFFNFDELARLADTITGLDNLLTPYSVTITEVSDATLANLVLDTGTTSAAGGLADGVLGCFISDGVTGEITLIQGWNWYTGADPTLIGSNQFDFQTILTHEMGHALGLGHSTNPGSVMYASLAPGVAHRIMTVQDLNIPDPGTGADGLHAALSPAMTDVSPGFAQVKKQIDFVDILMAQPGVYQQGVKAFGFSLADFSGPALPPGAYRADGFNLPAFDTKERPLPGSDTILSMSLGSASPSAAIDIGEAATGPGSDDNVLPSPKPSHFWELLDPARIERPVMPVQPETEKVPLPKPRLDGFWEALPPNPGLAEPINLNQSGNAGMDVWDLDESMGWLLFGMVAIPLTGFRDEKDLNSIRRGRRGTGASN